MKISTRSNYRIHWRSKVGSSKELRGSCPGPVRVQSGRTASLSPYFFRPLSSVSYIDLEEAVEKHSVVYAVLHNTLADSIRVSFFGCEVDYILIQL